MLAWPPGAATFLRDTEQQDKERAGKARGHPSERERKCAELFSLTLGVPAAMASFRMELLLPREKRMGSESQNCCGGQGGERFEGSHEVK